MQEITNAKDDETPAPRSAYVLKPHLNITGRRCYTLTVGITLCATPEKAAELRSYVAHQLPPKQFALLFRYDYADVVDIGTEEDQLTLENSIKNLILTAHYSLHKNRFHSCMHDLVYIE